MIWGENNQFPFYIQGVFPKYIQVMLINFCTINNINRHGYNFNSSIGRYIIFFINGSPHIIMHEPPKDIIYQKVDPFTFIKYYLCGTEPQWYEDLKVGDTVTIASYKDGVDEEDYPFSFTSEMESYAEESFIITEKKIWHNPSAIISKEEFNGDFYYYYLGNLPYTWHSSMFKDPFLKSMKKLILGEIEDFIL